MTVLLGHGSGGSLSHAFLEELILPTLQPTLTGRLDRSEILEGAREDAALLKIPTAAGRLAITTDSFVVNPLFFPGGDIGDLAVNGTVNDLAVSGAIPRYITLALIIEEGLPLLQLETILASIARCARAAGVAVVTGDTKVVERGKADGMYINTTGIGWVPADRELSSQNLAPCDRIIVSGPIGDHGAAVISRREGLAFETEIISDTAPVHLMTEALLSSGADIVAMRDPTRGGLATTIKEWAIASQVSIVLDEKTIPVSGPTLRACELLGLDPLFVANEGRLIAAVTGATCDLALDALRSLPEGAGATIIGEVVAEDAVLAPLPQTGPGEVLLHTRIGGTRFIDMLAGDQLPRIC